LGPEVHPPSFVFKMRKDWINRVIRNFIGFFGLDVLLRLKRLAVLDALALNHDLTHEHLFLLIF
jgi:hypothetical protein